ncbi:MAG: PAS domain-containing protein, partial [Myxococcaceae bacterium]
MSQPIEGTNVGEVPGSKPTYEELLARVAQLEQEHASFADRDPNPVAEADLGGRILYLNLAAERLFPDLRERGPAHPWLIDWEAALRTAMASDTKTQVREVVVGERHYQQTLHYLAEFESIRINAADITALKRTEEGLLRYELIARHVRDIVLFMRREDGRILEANVAATSAYGYSRAEMLSLSIHDLRALDTRPLTEEQMAIAEARGILFETVHQRKDGSTFPVEVSSRGATIGGTRSLISVVRDITERKKAEEALRQGEEEFRAFFENVGVGAVQLDLTGRYTRVNNRYCEITGYSREELLASRGPTDLSHPDDRERDRVYISAVLEGHAPPSIEKRVVRKDGKVVWAQVMSSVVRDARGHIVRSAALVNDITEAKRAEERLRTSEVRLRAIIEHAPMSMAIVGMDGTIEYINRKARTTFGYSPEDIPTMEHWWVLAYPDASYRREVISTWTGLTERALAEHREIEGREYRVTCKDGTVKTTH